MTRQAKHHRWLAVFLWISVLVGGVALGGKLFEFTVVISAWSANPPDSLSLLPYGPRHPLNPGDFFQPLFPIGFVGAVGALVCGRKAPRSYKVWLWVRLASMLVVFVVTPVLFFPMIRDLYAASSLGGLDPFGVAWVSRPLEASAAQDLVNRWLVLDWLRTALMGVGLVAAIKAVSSLHRAHEV